MCRFIEKNDKAPRMSGPVIDPEEKILGKWISGQKCNYELRGPEFSKQGMKTPELWQIWTDTIADPKYKKHLVIDRLQDWKENRMNVCEFIDKNGKAPSAAAKNLEEKTLARWVSSQKVCYNYRGPECSKQGMKNPEIWQIWTETIADPMYNKYLVLGVQGWMNDFANVCTFIDKNGKAPSSTAKDPEEKKIGCWISSQRIKYDTRGAKFSKERMKNEEVWQKWTETISHPNYEKYLVIDRLQDWMNDHAKLCEFIEKNHKSPSSHMIKDISEKKIGRWMGHQKHNYDPRGPAFSKHGMKTPEIWQIWTETLKKYKKYLVIDLIQDWKDNHMKMCEFIDKNGKIPSAYAKSQEEKTLSNWITSQKGKYDPRGAEFSKHGMKTTPELWQMWTDTIQKYPCLKKKGQGQEETPSPPPSKPKPRLVIKKSHLIPNQTASLECASTNPTPNPSTPESKRVITDSPYKLTGRAWAMQKSSTTHEKLQSNPAEWHAYHAARDISFQGYVDQSQIPRNRVIAHLANKRKHRLRILDLGCGRNNIAQHYADADKNHKFAIQGYDHVAEEGSGALIGNIADLAAQEEDESADICIYSQSLMGSDWRDYLTEGHRMLRYNGEFIISEHIKMLDDVRAELGRLGCKVESVNADADAEAADASEADDKVAKWFVLIARKV